MTSRIASPRTTASSPRLSVALLLALALLMVGPSWAAPDAAGGTSRSKDVSAEVPARGRAVAIRASAAEVRVVRSDSDTVEVQAHLEFWSNREEWMDSVEKGFDVEINEGANRIEIVPASMGELEERGFLSRILGRHQVSWNLDLEVSVPQGTRLEVDNSYGAVRVEEIGGEVDINNTSGAVSVSDAGRTRIENRYGDVEAGGIDGSLGVNVTSGELTVRGVTGDAALTCRYGGARVSEVLGALQLDVASGAVDVSKVASATVRVAYGNATVHDVDGELSLDVGSGRAEVSRVTGHAEVEVRYGSFGLSDIGGWLRLRGSSAGGRVEGVDGQLDLTTSYEDVHIERVGGVATIENTSGGVTLLGAGGDTSVRLSYAAARVQGVRGTLRVTGQSAAVSVRDVDGPVEVETSYEGVTIADVAGSVAVRNQSGRVTVSGLKGGALTASHSVTTSYGDIDFTWPSQAPSPTFRLETSYGSAGSDFPGRKDERSSRQVLEGDGAGEASIVLTAQSGSAWLRRR